MKLAAKILRIPYAIVCIAALMISGETAFAVAYTYPGNLIPPQILTGTDTATINSGTAATPSSDAVSYTIDFSAATGATITVGATGTASYNGTNGAGAAISSIRNSAAAVTNTININGALNAGTGLYGIYINNSNASPNDLYNISTTGTITGAVLSSGVTTINLAINGASANIIGTITLGVASAGISTLTIENGANFAPTEQIANISLIQVQPGSSMTFNTLNTNIKGLSVAITGTANINYPLLGLSSSDGNIVNDGTMNIANNILKTGTFTGNGTNVVSDTATVTTTNYTVTNHTALMQDVSNYSNMTLSAATFASSNFAVTYNGGYLPGSTYDLVTATAITPPTFGSVPTSTMFLTFGTPAVNGNKIQILLTRNPFNNFATTSMTQSIGATLEVIGNNNPSTSMLALLNAVEANTNSNAVEYSLRQLAPLSSAPLYGFEIQDTTMYQTELRLASLHNQRHYVAGDIARDNHIWVRPFGTYANQQAKDDSLGYYGSSGGITAGFDRNLGENYLLGASGGYVLSHVNDKINPESSTTIKSYLGMIYGSYDFTETRYLDWIFAVIANEFNAERMININGYQQMATSSYSSQQFSVKGLWSKDYSAFNFMQLTPQASAQYTFAKQYSYTESGANAANLNISRTNSNIVQLAVGGKAGVPLWLNPSIVIPEIHAMFFYNPVVGQQNTIFSFVDGGGQTTSFFNLNRTGLIYGAALTIAVVDRLEVKFNLDVDIEDRFNGYTAYLNLRYFLGC